MGKEKEIWKARHRMGRRGKNVQEQNIIWAGKAVSFGNSDLPGGSNKTVSVTAPMEAGIDGTF